MTTKALTGTTDKNIFPLIVRMIPATILNSKQEVMADCGIGANNTSYLYNQCRVSDILQIEQSNNELTSHTDNS